MEKKEAIRVAKEFNVLLMQLRTDLANRMISFADADINAISRFLGQNIKFFTTKFVGIFCDYLNNLVKVLWQAPGWEEASNKIKVSNMRRLAPVPG